MTDFEFAASAGQMLDAALPDESPGSEHGNGKVTCLWRRYHPRLIAMAQQHLPMSPLTQVAAITPVCLHSVARLLGNERRCNHLTAMPQRFDLPLQYPQGPAS